MMRTIKMQTSVALFHDDSLLDRGNFSHYTQYHSIIVKSKGEQLLMVNWLLF